eukprot:SAG31_NODE_12740_length_920_cov_0.948843_1_plen_64_part_10
MATGDYQALDLRGALFTVAVLLHERSGNLRGGSTKLHFVKQACAFGAAACDQALPGGEWSSPSV